MDYKYKPHILTVLLLLVFMSTTWFQYSLLRAQVNRYVTTDGYDPFNECTDPGFPCASVQQAIDMSSDGDTIVIAGGIYTERLYIFDKSLNIRGNKFQKPIIQAHQGEAEVGRVLYIDQWITDTNYVTIENITFRNGHTDGRFPENRGGGILNKANLRLKNVDFIRNSAGKKGGGLASTGNVVLDNVSFIHNKAGEHGGGLYVDASETLLNDVTFNFNTAGGKGGGFYIYNSNAVLTDLDVLNNKAEGSGGGGYTVRSDIDIRHSSFELNYAEWAGGLYLTEGDFNCIDLMFTGNTAYEGGGGLLVSGWFPIRRPRNTLNIENILLKNNISEEGGGGGMYLLHYLDVTAKNITVIGNSADYPGGGGIYFDGQVDLKMENCLVANNMARIDGGGIYTEGSYFEIKNLIVRNNSTRYGNGGGIRIFKSGFGPPHSQITNALIVNNYADGGGGGISNNHPDLVLNNATIAFNRAQGRGGGIRGGSVPLNNCIIWGNTSGEEKGHQLYGYTKKDAKHCLISNAENDIYSSSDDIDSIYLTENPQFRDPAGGDFNLKSSSPAIDAGITLKKSYFPRDSAGVLLDLNNNRRIVNNTIDIGAYENQKAGKITTSELHTFSDDELTIVPNPTVNTATIHLPQWNRISSLNISVFSPSGEKVVSRSLLPSGYNNKIAINVENLQSGTYFIVARSGERRAVGKVMVVER